LNGLRSALGLLTRLPVGDHGGGEDAGLRWFPVVGVLVGLIGGGVYSLAYRFLPSLLAAVLAVAAGAVVTGALHEDGLADTADALGSGASGEEALRIMRDPSLGTFGVLALTTASVWKIAALGALGPVWALTALVVGGTLGRTAAVVLIAVTEPARPDGLAHSVAGGASRAGTWWAVVSGVAVAAAALGPWAPGAVALVAGSAWLVRRTALRRVGGITGDLLGACEQVAELVVLTLVAGAAWFGDHPWWAGPVR